MDGARSPVPKIVRLTNNATFTRQRASHDPPVPKIIRVTMQPTLEQCINTIRHAPDILFEKRGIILDYSCQGEDGKLLKSIREEFRIKAQWLEYYLLDRTNILSELTFTWKIEFKPLAEMAVSYFRLAQEVLLLVDEMQEQIPTAGFWMMLCELQTCDAMMRNSGYAQKQKSVPLGKSTLYQQAVEHYDALGDVNKLSIARRDSVLPIQGLEGEAALIAQHDSQFRNSYFAEYRKTQKRCFRSLRDSPVKHLILQADGTLQVLGIGQGKKQKKSTRGFIPSM